MSNDFSDDSASKGSSGRGLNPSTISLEDEAAHLTQEWDVRNLPFLDETSVLDVTSGERDAPTERRTLPPVPPSQRRGSGVPADSASPGVTSVLGGSAGEALDRPVQAITVPKPRRGRAEASERVRVPSLELLGTTLPPLSERQPMGEARAAAEPHEEIPSVEREAVGKGSPWSEWVREHRPLAAMGTLLVAAFAYSISRGLLDTRRSDAAPPTLPKFLETAALLPSPAASTTHAAPSASVAPAPPPPLDPPEATSELTEPAAASAAPPLPPLADAVPAPTMDPGSPGTRDARSAAASEAPASAPSTIRSAPPSPSRVTEPPSERRSSSSSPQASSSAAPAKARAAVRAAADDAAVQPLTTYTYGGERQLFRVATAPMRVTDLVLEPGEKLSARPTAGDSARWVISVVDTVVRGTPQQHVFIKPLRAGLRTNLTLTTDRRTYFLELSSDDETYMAAVQWRYPEDAAARRREALAQAELERQRATEIKDLNALRFDYRIEVSAGSPSWKPTMVFDDGHKTFIRFPGPVSPSRAPALFVLRSADAQYVNYRVKHDLYVLDRLIETAELRLVMDGEAGERGAQDIVRITRKRGRP